MAASPLMMARTLLSSSLPLGVDMCPYPFFDELEGPLVLGDREQLHGLLLIRGEATHCSDHVLQELGVCW